MVYLYLDGLKLINDTYGHAAGDALLIDAANPLTSCVRSTDCVARMGADEFVLLLTGLTEPAQAQRLAELADAALRRVFHVQGRTLAISASLGVVMARPGQAAGELLHDADRAMYRHKQLAAGGGRSL